MGCGPSSDSATTAPNDEEKLQALGSSDTWPNGVHMYKFEGRTSTAVSMVAHSNSLYMAWKNDDGDIMVSSSSTPLERNWHSPVQVQVVASSKFGPAITYWENQDLFVLVWVSNTGALMWATSKTPLEDKADAWTSHGVLASKNGITTATPSLCVLQDHVYCVFNNNGKIYFSHSIVTNDNSYGWSNGSEINSDYSTQSDLAIACTVWKSKMYISYISSNNTKWIYINGSSEPETSKKWTGNSISMHDSSENAPAVVGGSDKMYIAWKGGSTTNRKIYMTENKKPLSGQQGWPWGSVINPNNLTYSPVSLAVMGGKIYCAWKTTPSEDLIAISGTATPWSG